VHIGCKFWSAHCFCRLINKTKQKIKEKEQCTVIIQSTAPATEESYGHVEAVVAVVKAGVGGRWCWDMAIEGHANQRYRKLKLQRTWV
jgi:hypothetical protein